jgi:hypothetical protein
MIAFYRTFHPTVTEHTFFSAAHGTFSKINHILGHRTSLIKYMETEKKLPMLYQNIMV